MKQVEKSAPGEFTLKKRVLSAALAAVLAVGMCVEVTSATPDEAYGATAENFIDLNEVFTEWVNYPDQSLGAGYKAGWKYTATGDGGYLNTTANVGFTGYYNPNLMSFTTGTFSCDFSSSDVDPWGWAWGIRTWKNSSGQDVYSFYVYEECGDNKWCIAYIEEWTPAKNGSCHIGPVYHGIINGTDSQKTHNGATTGTANFAKGTVLAYGSATVKGIRHRVTINVTKNQVTVTSGGTKLITLDTPVQAGSFGPCSASNAQAYYYSLSMEAAEDNGAIKANFKTFANGEETSAGKMGDELSMADDTWLDPATKATIKSETWTVKDPKGNTVYSEVLSAAQVKNGEAPKSITVDQEGEYSIVLDVVTSQGLTAKKTKYFTVSESSIVTVRYVDESGNKLCDNVTYIGRPGHSYTTADLSFNGYVLTATEGEPNGKFVDGPTAVTYIYKKVQEGEVVLDDAQPVTVKYVDSAGTKLADDVVYKGDVGEDWAAHSLSIPGYKYSNVNVVTHSEVEAAMMATTLSDIPGAVTATVLGTPGASTFDDEPAADTGDREGKFGYLRTTVTYTYDTDPTTESNAGSVLVRYVDSQGNTIKEDAIINGAVGDAFDVDLPKITKYKLKTVDGAEAAAYSSTLDGGVHVLNVVYEPVTYTGCSVMVRYIDQETRETIRTEVIDGEAGDDYEAKPMDIPGYELVEVPANTMGTLDAENVTYVYYVYKSTLNKEVTDDKTGKTIKLNKDTDGDGIPDVNIDLDGDGKPDVNIDTDDDGIPDTNVVLDEEGKPKGVDPVLPEAPFLNVDIDGDGEPDLNIDKDGDGIPEVNVVLGEDGKPKAPDLENPEKPLINVDTDGDGEPDLNIDKDGDFVPDLNVVVDEENKPKPVDPKDPEPPMVNIDANGDGKPDVNIDKDGDFVPDINHDTDGDGKADLNVDTDGDGEPDVNIDTNDDGVPDKNVVDANGDGKPDGIDPNDPATAKPTVNIEVPDPSDPTKTIIINKDVDGDGIPDINIDTDGDGIPDINIDTDGDDIPEVNIDSDNTGQWKPSSMGGNADGVWKPDTFIDIDDGNGPVYSDYTPPVDDDKNGVDDRWKPNGDSEYDWTTGGTKQLPPDDNQGTTKPDDEGNPGNQTPGDDDKPGELTPGSDDPKPNGDPNRPPTTNSTPTSPTTNGDGTSMIMPNTGDTNPAGTNSTWNPLLSSTGQTLSKTADEMLPFILMIGAAVVVSSLIAASAFSRRREEEQ